MGEVVETEKILSYSFPIDEKITEEMRLSGINLRNKLMSSLEGLSWFITNFNSFTLQTSYYCSFICAIRRLVHHSYEITNDHYPIIQTFLFVTATQNISKYSPETLEQLSIAQANFAILTFPQQWNGFFEAVNQFPDILKVKTLMHFFKLLVIPTPHLLSQNKLIKNFLIQSQILPNIYQLAINGITNGFSDSYLILAYLCRWADISWVQNVSNIQTICNYVNDSNKAIGLLNIYSSLMYRSIPREEKAVLATQLQIIPLITQICQTFGQDQNVLIYGARATQAGGYSFIGTELSQEFLKLSLLFLQMPNEEVSRCVLGFIYTFALNVPESVNVIMPSILQRIMITYNTTQYQPTSNFLNQLNRIILIYLEQNTEIVLQILLAFSRQSNMLEDTLRASTFLEILYEILLKKINVPYFAECFGFFTPLFNVHPPINNEQFYVMYNFLKLTLAFQEKDQRFQNQYNNEIFNSLMEFSLADQIHENARKLFANLLKQFAIRRAKRIAVNEEIISRLMSVMNNNYTVIAARLTYGLYEAKLKPVLYECIDNLVANIQNADNHQSIELLLNFMSNIDTSVVADKVIPLISQLIPKCQNDDELLSLLIRCINVFTPNGFQLFLSVIQFICGRNSISAVCEVATKFIYISKNKKVPNFESNYEWILKLLEVITNLFFVSLAETMSMPCSQDIEIAEATTMVRFVYQFYMQSVEIFQHQIDLFIKILENTKELLLRRYDNPDILYYIFLFLQCSYMLNADLIIQEFTPISFNFLLSSAFDPTKVKYQRLLVAVANFHIPLSKKNYGLFSNLLSQTLQSLGASEEFCSNYQKVLEADARNVPILLKNLSAELFVIRNGNTWIE